MASELPDHRASTSNIDEAIESGLRALDAANIKIKQTPLFLVVGLPGQLETQFRRCRGVGNAICVDGDDLPVRWYGDSDALWLTLTGVSAVSHHEAWTHSPTSIARGAAGSIRGSGRNDADSDFMGTLAPGAPLVSGGDDAISDVRSTLAPGSPPTSRGDDAISDIRGTLPSGSTPVPDGDDAGSDFMGTLAPGAILDSGRHQQDATDLEHYRSVLIHFVRSLKRVRDPVVPVNGVAFHMPFAGLFDKGDRGLHESVKTDMTTLQRELEAECLCLAIFSGIERSAEFVEFIRRLGPDAGRSRLGCSFPPLIHLERPHIAKMHSWLVRFMEVHVRSQFSRSLHDPGNAKMFRLLDDFRQSKTEFIRLLSNAFPDDLEQPFFFGGSYFGSVEKVGDIERPFLDLALRRLAAEHDDMLSWSAPARQRDQQHRKRGVVFLIAGAILAGASLFFAFSILRMLL